MIEGGDAAPHLVVCAGPFGRAASVGAVMLSMEELGAELQQSVVSSVWEVEEELWSA